MTCPRRNIELKARLASLAQAHEVAAAIATARLGSQQQIDIYFRCDHGRLKLRQIDDQQAQLIWYERPDTLEPKGSNYRLVEVSSPEELTAALDAAYGIEVVVKKKREIFLYQNVRIHLDQVVGLGTFLEFEAVLNESLSDADGHEQLDWLREQFHISAADLLAPSYRELLLALRELTPVSGL